MGGDRLWLVGAIGLPLLTGAVAGCNNECSAGQSRCVNGSTIEACVDSAGDVPLGGGNVWNSQACGPADPFCVVLSSGAARCTATANRVPVCDGGSPEFVCWGEIPGSCDDGFVTSTEFTCVAPASCTVTAENGAFCASDAGPDVDASAPLELDAGPDGGEASATAFDAAPGIDGAAGDATTE
jgi:hypothetical protein